LLECNANVNVKNNERQTALHLAVRSGHEAVVRQLLEHKADVDAKEEGGVMALHLAARDGHKVMKITIKVVIYAQHNID
jgi:ankyrin repeat protein